jgi:hypothetical protein
MWPDYAPTNKEALTWLQENGGNSLGSTLSHQDALALVFQIYRVGAPEVWAIDIKENEQLGNTDKLIIVLPFENEKRVPLFQWYNECIAVRGWRPVLDKGQDYFFLLLD